MSFPRLTRLAVVVMMTAAAGFVVPTLTATPAQGAVCSSTRGVSVVVDFGDLGGGVRTVCVAGGAGQTAAQNFAAAGYPLTQVQRQPGFVCRVSGVPQSQGCVDTPPADDYWGLFISKGNGGWSYATLGAYSLKVSNGDFVGFAFQSTKSRRLPGMAPVRPAPPKPATPKPTLKPTKKPQPEPTKKPQPEPTRNPGSQQPTAPGPASTGGSSEKASPPGTASPEPAESGGPDKDKSGKKPGKSKKGRAGKGKAGKDKAGKDKAEAEATESEAGESGSQQGPDSGDGDGDGDQDEIGSKEAAPDKAPDPIPTWVFLLVVLGLAGAAGGATFLRRRSGS